MVLKVSHLADLTELVKESDSCMKLQADDYNYDPVVKGVFTQPTGLRGSNTTISPAAP